MLRVAAPFPYVDYTAYVQQDDELDESTTTPGYYVSIVKLKHSWFLHSQTIFLLIVIFLELVHDL